MSNDDRDQSRKNTHQEVIVVDRDVYERFEERRLDGVDEMSASMLLDSLLSTVDAVDEGYYDDV